jgi:hypothetical protein
MPGSILGGATGMSWISRHRPVKATSVVLNWPYHSRCRANSQIMQPISTGKCRMS